MPQLDAAKKALRASQRQRIINDRWRRKLRFVLHAVRDAIAEGKQKEAQAAFVKAASILDRAARHHIIHRNKAARKKSRLQKVIAKLSA